MGSSSSDPSSSSSGSRSMPRFQLGWTRFIPFLGYHHVLMILIIISVILQSILVAGCATESLSGMYLLSLRYTDRSTPYEPNPAQANTNGSAVLQTMFSSGTPTLQVRSSYFGVCISTTTGWLCSRSSARLASVIRDSDTSELSDPLNLVYAAEKFKSNIVFVGLFFISISFALITFVLLATFPGWHEEDESEGSDRDVKPFPSRPVSQVALACSFISALMAILASFWQHMASVAASTMAEAFTYNLVSSGVGAGAMVMGWLSSSLLTVVTLGLLVMILSIRVLNMMTA